MSTVFAKEDMSYYIKSAIGIAIMFGFGYLPPIEPITPLGMKVAGAFLGCVFLWSTVSLIWPSLLGIIAMLFSGYGGAKVIIGGSFGDTIPVLLLFAMTLFGTIQHYDVPRYVSRWFLTRKAINGRPLLFTYIFMLATNIMAFTSGSVIAILIFMWAILYGILKELGYTKDDKYAQLIVVGTMVAGLLGQPMKPFQGSAVLILGSFEKAAGVPMEYLTYLMFGFIMNFLVITCYTLAIKYVFRADLTKLKEINTDYFAKDPLPPMSGVQKAMFGTLIAFWVLVLLPSILPSTVFFIPALQKLGALGILITFTAIFVLIKVDGKPILPIKEIMAKHVSWDIYFLLSVSMLLSAALSNPKTGLTEFIANSLTPLLGGHSALGFTVIVLIFGIAITQFANNGVTGAVLMPVIKIFSEQSGTDFGAIATIFCFIMHSAMLTPAGSPFAAMLFSNKDWITPKQVLKYASFVLTLMLSLYLLIGIPLVNAIYTAFPLEMPVAEVVVTPAQ